MSLSQQIISLNSKTNGKDKIYRSIQYGCKLIWYILWKKKNNHEYIEILKKIEAAMSNTRKILRLGKTHDMLENALKSIHLQDDFLRYILTTTYINQGCYLVLDNVLWFHSMGLINMSKSRLKDVGIWSNKFWLFSAILYVARDFHDLLNLYQTEPENKFSPVNKYTLNQTSGAYTSIHSKPTFRQILKRIFRKLRSIILNRKNHPLLIDSIKNFFDLFLPLSNLDYIKLSPGLQGLFGLISSLMSLIVVYDQRFKLTP